jgi:hypothetical protein
VTTPDANALPPDELERLERLHQKMKDEQEAWRKLLENLGKLKKKATGPTETKTTNE